MAIEEFEFTDVADFIHQVQAKKDQWEFQDEEYINPWFRGHSNAAYGLIPGVYRFSEEYPLDESAYRHDFQLKSHPYLSGMRATTDWEQYALMQHYGLPTRLLDWTEGALVALQFALLGTQRILSKDVAVWMLEPQWFNQILQGHSLLVRPDDEQASKHLFPCGNETPLAERPLAIEIPYNSPRITAQRGIFTVHGSNRAGLEAYLDVEGSRCCKMVLSKYNILSCRRQLRMAGISNTVIYPDLSGLCDELWHTWIEELVVDVEGSKDAAE